MFNAYYSDKLFLIIIQQDLRTLILTYKINWTIDSFYVNLLIFCTYLKLKHKYNMIYNFLNNTAVSKTVDY